MKYAIIALAILGSVAAADMAEARGRRGGCSSCAGGTCYVGGDAKMAAAPAPTAPAVVTEVAQPAAPVAVAAAPSTSEVASRSRRLFRRRS